jgi:hypothetical protein
VALELSVIEDTDAIPERSLHPAVSLQRAEDVMSHLALLYSINRHGVVTCSITVATPSPKMSTASAARSSPSVLPYAKTLFASAPRIPTV